MSGFPPDFFVCPRLLPSVHEVDPQAHFGGILLPSVQWLDRQAHFGGILLPSVQWLDRQAHFGGILRPSVQVRDLEEHCGPAGDRRRSNVRYAPAIIGEGGFVG